MTHVHLIGIGGSGMSAIARLLLERGYTVTGSDRVFSPLAAQLAQSGVKVFVGHLAANIHGADQVVRSSAVPDDNPEVVAAREAGIPVLKRSEFLGELTAGLQTIAVSGTHGKTTTTSMIAWLLNALGQDPSFLIGGVARNMNANAHAGRGRICVVEADEYDNMFLGLQPQIAVVTNLEHDHPDCFPTFDSYQEAYRKFVQRIVPGGGLLYCADDLPAAELLSSLPAYSYESSYGLSDAANYQAERLQPNELGGTTFRLLHHSAGDTASLGDVRLSIPGEHNVRNALAALAVIHQLGFSMLAAAEPLSRFQGAGRRFEILGETGGITIIDDYAHHPTAIRATLAAARGRFPAARIWAVWQPHTYTRMAALANDFSQAFADADQVIVTDVYAARESRQDVTPSALAAEMPHPAARFIAGLPEVSAHLLENLQAGDVLVVLSAGDADQISAGVLGALRQREGARG